MSPLHRVKDDVDTDEKDCLAEDATVEASAFTAMMYEAFIWDTFDLYGVEVKEWETPERIQCGAQAYPEASYMWRYVAVVVVVAAVFVVGVKDSSSSDVLLVFRKSGWVRHDVTVIV